MTDDGSIVERVLEGNRRYVATREDVEMPAEPAEGLLVLTCLDPRIDPLAMLGLQVGDAQVVRNAGAVATSSVLETVQLSTDLTATDQVLVIGHTDCIGHGRDDEETAEATLHAAERIRGARPDLRVSAMMLDVRDGRLSLLG